VYGNLSNYKNYIYGRFKIIKYGKTVFINVGLLLSLPSLIWFLIDTVMKITKFNKHLKESRTASMVNLEHHTIDSIEREIITKPNESAKRTLKLKKEITFKVAGIVFNGIQMKIKYMK